MAKGISINNGNRYPISFFPCKNDTFVIDYKYTLKELIYETYYCMVAEGFEYELSAHGCKETPIREIEIKKYIDLLGSSGSSWNWDLSLKVLNELKVYNTLKDQTKMVTLVDIMLLMSYQSEDRKIFNRKSSDMYLVFEKYGNDLGYILSSRKKEQPSLEMNNIQQQWLLSELLLAVSSLHSQKLMHRDLRPSNVCVSFEEKTLKLKNFGLSSGFSSKVYLYNQDDFEDEFEKTTNIDEITPIYTAPEIILDNASTPLVDVWGVGCIFAEILSGGSPLFLVPSELKPTQISKIGVIVTTLETKGGSLDKLSSNPLAIDLLRRMLVFNPGNRISLEEAMQHAYFGSGTELVGGGSSSSSRVVALAEVTVPEVVEVTVPEVVEPDAHALRKLIRKEMDTFEMNKKKKTSEIPLRKKMKTSEGSSES